MHSITSKVYIPNDPAAVPTAGARRFQGFSSGIDVHLVFEFERVPSTTVTLGRNLLIISTRSAQEGGRTGCVTLISRLYPLLFCITVKGGVKRCFSHVFFDTSTSRQNPK